MVARPLKVIPEKAKLLLEELRGRSCTLQRIGSDKSLFIGIGEIDTSGTKPHAEIEFGTYDCAWRVAREGKVICGSDDAVDEVLELENCFSAVVLGDFMALQQLSEFDVRLAFSTGVVVDIMCTISDDDEVIHVFFPRKEVLTFQPETGWRFGRSDEPWG
ncbi:MAG: hypothetical protein GY748_12730 [Planctomycetaceae bacterium]|nr:hypothetical protein [Planctomycetaceae bacterium]MCP4500760.1 hypothetical protein [Deltaproteobacteria bacterium]